MSYGIIQTTDITINSADYFFEWWTICFFFNRRLQYAFLLVLHACHTKCLKKRVSHPSNFGMKYFCNERLLLQLVLHITSLGLFAFFSDLTYLLWKYLKIYQLKILLAVMPYSYMNETSLRTAMFASYSDSIRPVLNQNDSVQVHFKLELLNVESLVIITKHCKDCWCLDANPLCLATQITIHSYKEFLDVFLESIRTTDV